MTIVPGGDFVFFPFDAPEHSSLDPIVLYTRKMVSGAACSKSKGHTLEITFISEMYLKIAMKLDMVQGTDRDIITDQDSGPGIIEFYGSYFGRIELEAFTDAAGIILSNRSQISAIGVGV